MSSDDNAISSKIQSDTPSDDNGATSSETPLDTTSANTGSTSSKRSDAPSVDDNASSFQKQLAIDLVQTVLSKGDLSKWAESAHIERHRSLDVYHDFQLKSHNNLNIQEKSICEGENSGESGSIAATPGPMSGLEPCPLLIEAWKELSKAVVNFENEPVGTVAALDTAKDSLNYDQVFVRDFIPAGLAYLLKREPQIVKKFLLKTVRLQSAEKKIDQFKLGDGVMPASFKVCHQNDLNTKEAIVADFGESAIGRVAPVDSGFWWIILLHAYTKSTGDTTLALCSPIQNGIRLILALCLSEGFDTFPTLLCADGCCMIDRRMGVYGYPIEIQALFFMALRCASKYLQHQKDGEDLIELINKRLQALSYHIREYFWLDLPQLNNIYRYKTEEYSHTAVNKFNVMPDSLPEWLFDFMPRKGGYFIGNVSPSRMDFRWFCLGNFVAILSSLATSEQSKAIMDLVEERWQELVGEMPLKACYPAMENHEWQIVTGCDPKNTRWSYHNGGSWPVLLWLLTAVCIKTGRPHIAQKAVELAERRLMKDKWPEYYDGKRGRYVGKQARKFQTWSIAGYIVAKMMLENPSLASIITLEDYCQGRARPVLRRSRSWSCSTDKPKPMY
ncbi:Plant neutral invertase family protein [Rhynchospora pubera]|uniref:Alkaline/neutral invertase n=1 Tax=Rhynchospora pubera TaxID=906938 RepID=A0AAV8G4X6_9POAL|nr:Plant neutral invertase family protein [Rhynchospora pubera]KAJ4800735.1 Plant neutral invertase family protein [Rhynchospora pubera]